VIIKKTNVNTAIGKAEPKLLFLVENQKLETSPTISPKGLSSTRNPRIWGLAIISLLAICLYPKYTSLYSFDTVVINCTMSEAQLSQKAFEALKHIRDLMMLFGRFPSVRELMRSMDYRSPRSAMLLLTELEQEGFLERRQDGTFRLVKDLEGGDSSRTVNIPLVGSVACGIPLMSEENVEAFYPVSIQLAKPGAQYFLLRAKGDSMNQAGIQNGDMILVRQQVSADNGQQVVALIDEEATVKEYQHRGSVVMLLPHSDNPRHRPILLESDFRIQGVVVAAIPRFNY
jgi:repressor LexA